MKIGIMASGFMTWGGGIDLLKNYINALLSQDCEIVLLIPSKDSSKSGRIESVKRLAKNIVKYLLGKKVVNNNVDKVITNFTDEFKDICIKLYDRAKLQDICDLENIDILFPSSSCLPETISTPWIGYIYDFQHKYFPQYFSERIRSIRDSQFECMLNNAKAVVANSNDTKKDCNKFFSKHKARIYVTPFAPIPRKEWLIDNRSLIEKYHIEKPFLIICNQLWQHKGHITAIDAFAKMISKDEYKEYLLVFTGALDDGRNPNYVQEVNERIHSYNLDNRVVLLGYIPKIEQVELVKKSKAVIQPTMFEGGPGGGAAYDAISLGKPIILSDIEVNKEVKSNLAFFFENGNAESLFETIDMVLKELPDAHSRKDLTEQGDSYKAVLGEYIMDMLNNEIKLQKEKH